MEVSLLKLKGIYIEDTGIGMEENELNNMWKRFYIV